jgi:hypothetical protein
MAPHRDQDRAKRDGTMNAELSATSFGYHVDTMLRYPGGATVSHADEAADKISRALHTSPLLFNDIQRGKALAGLSKLAMGTYEEQVALENAGRVSGLNRPLGAVVYSLSALYGPSDNLFLVTEGLNKIDRVLTASVLAEITRQDPSEHLRSLALQWLACSQPSEAANLVQELAKNGSLTSDMTERYERATTSEATDGPLSVSILEPEGQQTVARILPAMQVILSGANAAYGVKAVNVLAQESPLYAIPTLTLAAQVSDTAVRDTAVRALATIDPETANVVRETSPTLCRRYASPENSEGRF